MAATASTKNESNILIKRTKKKGKLTFGSYSFQERKCVCRENKRTIEGRGKLLAPGLAIRNKCKQAKKNREFMEIK